MTQEKPRTKRRSASQTLLRGLDIIEAVSGRTVGLTELAGRLGLARSTTHRIATALVERRYIRFVPREGYSLGPKLLHLGSLAHGSLNLVQTARPFLEKLALSSGDTICIGILDGWRSVCLDGIAGTRHVTVKIRIGERQPVIQTGLGRALLLNSTVECWREFHAHEVSQGRAVPASLGKWLDSMQDCARRGYAFDMEENQEQIRCVAAPIWSARREIVAAVSVSGAAQYMDDLRVRRLSADVRQTAEAISRELGWTGKEANGTSEAFRKSEL